MLCMLCMSLLKPKHFLKTSFLVYRLGMDPYGLQLYPMQLR